MHSLQTLARHYCWIPQVMVDIPSLPHPSTSFFLYSQHMAPTVCKFANQYLYQQSSWMYSEGVVDYREPAIPPGTDVVVLATYHTVENFRRRVYRDTAEHG